MATPFRQPIEGDFCPVCGKQVARPVSRPILLPIVRACRLCEYPLDRHAMLDRIDQEEISEVAIGFLDYEQLRIVSVEDELKSFAHARKHGVDAVAEFMDAVIFSAMNDYYIFNFGEAGRCDEYWRTIWQ